MCLKQDLVFNSSLNRQPVKSNHNWSDMVMPLSSGDNSSSSILDTLKFSDSGFRNAKEKGVAIIQS